MRQFTSHYPHSQDIISDQQMIAELHNNKQRCQVSTKAPPLFSTEYKNELDEMNFAYASRVTRYHLSRQNGLAYMQSIFSESTQIFTRMIEHSAVKETIQLWLCGAIRLKFR